jgi:hypothetical protein
MSGLEEQHVTHDVTERLSWWLFAPISKKRPTYETGQTNMQDICLACHASSQVDKFYEDAEAVVHSTNQKVQAALNLVKALRDEGHLTAEPLDEPIDFLLHIYGISGGVSSLLSENILFGPPLFAPLLFSNLAVLVGIGLYDLQTQARAAQASR